MSLMYIDKSSWLCL